MIFYNYNDLVRFISAGENKLIGITSGCYDLLHPLHVEYLNKCARECGELYVLIDSDKLINKHKDKTPLINEIDRAYMVDNLKSVTGVLVFNNLEDMSECIAQIGLERTVKVFKHDTNIYGEKLIEYGKNVENVIVPDVIRFQSTTEITNHLKQS